ncbi:hypothetical protein AWB99_01945 [Mycolicibacterium confluentis]|nr:hypothetical protein AWB99_01945 [Mycolicibacterium confluentis]
MAGLGGAGFPVYVAPTTDALRPADAVLILGGPGYARYPFGLELAAEGWAPMVVISNPNGARDPWLTEYCAAPHTNPAVQCFAPDPPTTRGEGAMLRQMADEHGWRRVIVVTFRPHISRARFILERCFAGELVMAASPTHLSAWEWASEYAYQSAGFARAVLQPGC